MLLITVFFLLIVMLLVTCRKETKDHEDKVVVKWLFPFTKSWQNRLEEIEQSFVNNSANSTKWVYKITRFVLSLSSKLHELIHGLIAVLVLSVVAASFFGFEQYWYLPIVIFFAICFLAGAIKSLYLRKL